MNTKMQAPPIPYDELLDADGTARPAAQRVWQYLGELPASRRANQQAAAERMLREWGATFSVYGDRDGTEKVLPFDIIPRVINAAEWQHLEAGLTQRVQALNLFIDDIYHDQRILKEAIVPPELVLSAAHFRRECIGMNPPQGVWCHITGTDLVRDANGTYRVLEDNLRCPSGVSYVLNNRKVSKLAFPDLLGALAVRPVEDYPGRLLDMLHDVAPEAATHAPRAALLTPGVNNSAHFEHAFLAQQTGIPLVEGRDLVVNQDRLYMRSTQGLQRIDVLYRRIDDDFLDPRVFRADSTLGVPGLMDAWRRGNVTLVNAPGTGVADDKAIYAYVPDMIRFYLAQDPILPNVETYLCWVKESCDYVLDHLDTLVVKSTNESGGYGMLIGPHATVRERRTFAARIRANPRQYIAQPTLSLSTVPVVTEDGFARRHVDLRPYVLYGRRLHVLPGGLTRVALRSGSLVVNSSQGGGSKDTWVLAGEDSSC